MGYYLGINTALEMSMNGAREYATLFSDNRQHGRLCLISGHHARGKTFHIYVVPEGFEVPHGTHPASCKEAVEVYGIVSGQPGWTESYGWLHAGKWQEDFESLVMARRAQIEQRKSDLERAKEESEQQERARQTALLSTYA